MQIKSFKSLKGVTTKRNVAINAVLYALIFVIALTDTNKC